MKKKLMLTVLSSVLTLGILGACGDAENEPVNDPGINDNGGMNDDFNNGGVDNDMNNDGMNNGMDNEMNNDGMNNGMDNEMDNDGMNDGMDNDGMGNEEEDNA